MVRTYIAIDLKSFYASAECQKRGLDPLKTCLVVADESRTDKTICLAVSPPLKAYGIPGRPRLFEVKQAVKKINAERKRRNGMKPFAGISADADELAENPSLELGFHIAVPHMASYEKYSTKIYAIYLRYIAPEDIHVYSIDEVIMDATSYLDTYQMNGHELAMTMIHAVLKETGITAAAGIGTNMYLAKVAMDIVAKHIPADRDGVRIAELDEQSYREQLWDHVPLTDFWRVGRGKARRLEKMGIRTMGDLALASIQDEDALFKTFGVNAELLIDHAWGEEPCTMAEIKGYQPAEGSLGSGQVLLQPYSYEKGELIVREMADSLAMRLREQKLVCDSVALGIGYDASGLDPDSYDGTLARDHYGRLVPKPAGGRKILRRRTASSKLLREAFLSLYHEIVNPDCYIRRVSLTAMHTMDESEEGRTADHVQTDLFHDAEKQSETDQREDSALQREKKAQEAILQIRDKYGDTSVIRGMNLEKGATARNRANQIGGHRK